MRNSFIRNLYLDNQTGEAQSTQIRFHIVFIETANFSLRFHHASTRKRSKTMIVFTENDNFWKQSPMWKDLKTIYYYNDIVVM